MLYTVAWQAMRTQLTQKPTRAAAATGGCTNDAECQTQDPAKPECKVTSPKTQQAALVFDPKFKEQQNEECESLAGREEELRKSFETEGTVHIYYCNTNIVSTFSLTF